MISRFRDWIVGNTMRIFAQDNQRMIDRVVKIAKEDGTNKLDYHFAEDGNITIICSKDKLENTMMIADYICEITGSEGVNVIIHSGDIVFVLNEE